MDILPQLIANSLIAGAAYALLAMSFSLVFGVTKFFNLAHGSVAAVGGYTIFYLAKLQGMSLTLAIPLALLGAIAVAVFLERFVYRPLRLKRATNSVLLVASLGAFTALEALIAILFSNQFQTLSGVASNPVHIFLAAR